MISRIFHVAVIALGAMAFSSAAHAALVTSTNSVSFELDITSMGPSSTLISWNWSGTGGDLLRHDASMDVSFGSVAGGDDFGSFVIENMFNFDLNNWGTGQGAGAISPLSNVVFMTFGFVDDNFDVDFAGINVDNGGTRQFFGSSSPSNIDPNSTVSAVPVPAALPLLATALAGLGLMGWRKQRFS